MQSTSLAGRTILVVEDEPLIALDIVTAFEKVGAVVVAARSLAQARGLVEQEGLSAAVVDFGLADGDADAMCERLKARDIPYVLHSGYSDEATVRGCVVVVPKPAHPTALIEAIVEILGNQNDASARRIERATTYSPDRLNVLGIAFDGAWAIIAGNFSDAAAAKTARNSLASIILSLPRSEIDDAEQIKTAALKVMVVGDRDGLAIECAAEGGIT